MKIAATAKAMQALAGRFRQKRWTIGFVPTMGALHEGHLSLIERARKENDRVVVSIFVNPTQFGPNEDFHRYPRPFVKDAALCQRAGVDVIYHPSVAAMYPEGYKTEVDIPSLTGFLCGRFRPGHFRGVLTVVLKLFSAVQPDRAYFGEKDYQQLTLIKRMAADLDLTVKVVGCPIVREKNGLALSSRNAYLSPLERSQAATLSGALREGARLAKRGSTLSQTLRAMRSKIETIPDVRIDYISIVDAASLLDVTQLRGALRILAAIRIGKTRLIDNIAVKQKAS